VLQEMPALLIGSAFLLSLLVGSFLNVVIHRLPVMLDRQWRAQAEEMLVDTGAAVPGPQTGPRRRRRRRRTTSSSPAPPARTAAPRSTRTRTSRS
jgi:prepilin signal peptidase PulO-like enzyme (type II secretory pathway)